MLGHQTGMNRLSAAPFGAGELRSGGEAKGARAVALITGEEKILPPNPRYFVCTVESMPLDRPVDFLAVDEIQLLRRSLARPCLHPAPAGGAGTHETLMLGPTPSSPCCAAWCGGGGDGKAALLDLRYTGARKVTRLPPRSAVVAFAIRLFALAD